MSAVLGVVLVAVPAGILLFTVGWDALVRQVTGVPQPSARRQVARTIDATGRLLVTINGGLSLVSLPDRRVQPLVDPGPRGVVTSVRWHPDGMRAAYAYHQLREGESQTRSDVYLTDLTGATQPLIEAAHSGTILEAPAWSPDGTAVYFSSSALENQRPVQHVERFDVATRTRSVMTTGFQPDISPDGTQLAFLRYEGTSQALILSRIDGTDQRTLIPGGRYSLIGRPRFSPDGRTIAVPLAAPAGQARESQPAWPFGFLTPSVAFAHGDPSELYLVDISGGESRQLTAIREDEPSVTWSPDGAMMALYATQGLYLVDRNGGTTLAMDQGGYGGVDWTR